MLLQYIDYLSKIINKNDINSIKYFYQFLYVYVARKQAIHTLHPIQQEYSIS